MRAGERANATGNERMDMTARVCRCTVEERTSVVKACWACGAEGSRRRDGRERALREYDTPCRDV